MPTELRTTISARELGKMKKQGGLSGKIAESAIAFLEKYFGTPLLLDVPPVLQEIDTELFEAIQTAEKLQALGIIEKIEKRPNYPDEPFIHRFSITTQTTKQAGSGADFFSERSAIWKAIGEATERDLWATENDILKSVLHLPYEKIAAQALDIFKLAGFSEEQKRLDPRLSFNEKTVFGWISATSLSGHPSKEKIFCPAQLVNSHYFKKNVIDGKTSKEPILRRCITTGVATSGILEEAIVKGILEVIERDAYIIAYLNKISPLVIDFEHLSFQDTDLEKVFKMFRRYHLEAYLLKLPTDFSVPVVSAIILDKSGQGPAFVIGNSAKLDLKSAILGALTEALSIRLSLRRDWETKKVSPLPELEKFGQYDRMIYWARPENSARLDFMIRGEKVKIDLSATGNFFDNAQEIKDRKYFQRKLEELVGELQKKSYKACYVELSNKAVQKLGLHCVQVVIPELQPIHLEERFPCFGGKRLQEVPKLLGYAPAEKINQEPHPFG
ncbi:MAG: YcaO-like family protein [Parcubacteria group bacterium]